MNVKALLIALAGLVLNIAGATLTERSAGNVIDLEKVKNKFGKK